MSLLEDIERAFAEVSGVDQMKSYVQAALAEGTSPLQIIQSMRDGLSAAGRKYERGEYFLSELIMTGIMAQELSAMLKPHLQRDGGQFLARIAIGTVQGDLHDIGKNLVSTMLSSAGFEIRDLGVDVLPEKFVVFVAGYSGRAVLLHNRESAAPRGHRTSLAPPVAVVEDARDELRVADHLMQFVETHEPLLLCS
jgi:methanogenic corrinoid protein MtbC1